VSPPSDDSFPSFPQAQSAEKKLRYTCVTEIQQNEKKKKKRMKIVLSKLLGTPFIHSNNTQQRHLW
jgi:hypothetical protein